MAKKLNIWMCQFDAMVSLGSFFVTPLFRLNLVILVINMSAITHKCLFSPL